MDFKQIKDWAKLPPTQRLFFALAIVCIVLYSMYRGKEQEVKDLIVKYDRQTAKNDSCLASKQNEIVQVERDCRARMEAELRARIDELKSTKASVEKLQEKSEAINYKLTKTIKNAK